MREKEDLELYLSKLIDNRLDKVSLTDPSHALVFNGGTGVGKTTAIMERLKPILEERNKRPVKILIVESRSATRDQLNDLYQSETREENGIYIVQRYAFARMIEEQRLPSYDYIILDECHSLFSDSSFADDAVIVSYWIENGRREEKLIFITACDVYFDELARKFIKTLTYDYFFPDFTKYYTGTSVRQLSYIKTSKLKETVDYIMKEKKGKKGLIFLQSARDVIRYSNYYNRMGYKTGAIISKMNETSASLALVKEDYEDLGIAPDLMTLSEVMEILDQERKNKGLEGIRDSLLHKTYPSDIDVIFATNTISEGISIESLVDFIVIEGFGEEEVEQKSGRYRGNLDELFLIFYPQKFVQRMKTIEETYKFLIEHPNDLAEFYGRQEGGKIKFKFVLKRMDDDDKPFYYLNIPALLAERKKAETYYKLMNEGLGAVKELYGHKISGSIREIETKEIRETTVLEEIGPLVERWGGIPLAGSFREAFLADCINVGIRTKDGDFPGIKGCFKFLRDNGVEIKKKTIGKKDLKQHSELEKELGTQCFVILNF